jgi:glycosyltransferase involved in cell wall biosynthesis
VASLSNALAEQIAGRDVEHLVFVDNRKRSIGEKRDALLRLARGRYVAFCDDDDEILPGYIDALLDGIHGLPDVVTFKQEAVINGEVGWIEFRLGNPNETWRAGQTVRRNAWHVCAWKRSLAVLSQFPANNYGEDWAFAARLCAIPGLRSEHVDKVIHRYVHSAATTLAPPPLTNAQ